MCGIVGIVAKKKRLQMSTEELLKMCRMQKHRGPDDEGGVSFDLLSGKIEDISIGNYVQCKGLFGFERLSIQDLSQKGHQPMQNADGTIAIIFNGEIYNFRELRAALKKKGHVFNSGTDTEIILHLYMEYGIEKTLSELNGMFAFAIVDIIKKEMFIARDRFGIKPLYFTITDEAFLFSSELKSFIPYHGFNPKLNMSAVEEYMLFKNLMRETLYENVEQLEPGHLAIYDLETNEIEIRKYFDVESYNRNNNERSYQDIKEQVWETMRAVLRRQVVSDTKVGCQLSGGIDSSILVKVLADEHELYDTVSCKVNCEQQTDAPYIDAVNNNLRAMAHVNTVDEEFFINYLIDVVWHFDGGLSHTPAVGMFQISKCAHDNGIKVLLSGEGADEIFGGYKCFYDSAFRKKISENSIIESMVFRDGRESKELLQKVLPSIKPEQLYQKRIEHAKGFTGSSFDRQVKYEMTTQLRELLIRQDKMAMAHSVENRVPYLDNEMVQLAWNIPEKYLMDYNSKEGKYILKDIAAELFGAKFAFRRKVGFFIPGNMFLGSNMEFVHMVLQCIRKRGIIQTALLEQWAEKELHIYGALNYFQSALFLKMFTLEIWCQLFIDGLSVEECKRKLRVI